MNEQAFILLSGVERDVVNRRCMIGTVVVNHLSCLSIGTQSIIGIDCAVRMGTRDRRTGGF